jgi:PAS domain S-box-containing protein
MCMILSRSSKIRILASGPFSAIAILLASLWLAGYPASSYAQQKLPLLTRAEAVRRLSDEQVALGFPVRIQGFVTYYDPDWPILYVQDRTCGINVELEQQDYSLKAGQKVEVEGISAQGSILPIISKARIKQLGEKGLPPLRKVSLAQLDIKRDDSQWMQVEGIVHNSYQDSRYSIFEVYEGKNKVQIRVPEFAHASASSLIDAVIQAQGVLAVTTDAAHKPIGFELRVSEGRELVVIAAPPAPPTQIPVTKISALTEDWKTAPPRHRIRVQGVVMPGDREGTLLVRDSSGIIAAQTLFTRPIAPGDEVDLIGFADLGSPVPRIINAVYLRIKALAIQSKEESGLPTLTSIKQIHRLRAEEAARGYPVRIQGIITYHNPQLSMTFIQDENDAIYLQSLDPTLALEEGKKYEVEGFSAPGDFAPIIVKPKFRLIGRAQLPPALLLTLDQLSTGQYDCLRVKVRGIVRSVRQVGNRWRLELFNEGKGIEVWLPNLASSAHVHSFQDAMVLAAGICSIQISDRGNITGFRLNVPSIEGIHLEEPARADPFSAPLRPIRDIFRYSSKEEAGHRVRIQGVLLHQQPGRALYIKDESGSIVIPVGHILPVNPSDLLTVSGYPVPGEFSPTMDHALVKRLSSRPPPEPRILPDAHALNNNFHGDLVKIRVRLIDQWHSADGRYYLLQDLNNTGASFEALLETSASQSPAPALRNGSELELTGIYILQSRATLKYGFLLLLRTPEDIRVLKNAPWLTLRYVYWTLCILLFLIISALAWITMLRRRVRRQTKTIRDQIEAEAALEKKYQELFERSNDIVFSCDTTGRLKSINRAGIRILGYSPQEMMQLVPGQLIAPTSLPGIMQWIELRDKGIENLTLECELIAKDGHSVLVEVNAEIIHTDGQPAGAQGIARDITERKQAEEALRLSEEKLRQGQKLEAIGKLAGGIAHDFNNILSAILGYAELSSEEVSPDHPIRANLDQIIKAGKRARDVVQQILAFSRKLDQERRPIQLQVILDEALKLLKATLPATIQIETDIDPECSPVLADPTQMHQVILNLATNAAYAMNTTGGLLKIELRPSWPEGGLFGPLPELPPGKYVALSVSDTGPGIDPKIQKHIFEPYFTTKSAGEGSGLGLAVVHGIVQSHGGAISVKSAPGEGACFQVHLPTCQEKPVSIAAPAPEKAKGQGRILLVDDEEAIVALGIRSLSKLGYLVTGETRSVRALEIFSEDPDQFDLVVTDQTMPNLTGLLLAQEIWKIRPNLPVIISSGYSEQVTIEKAASLGFNTYLSKPYTTSELAKAIKQSLNR